MNIQTPHISEKSQASIADALLKAAANFQEFAILVQRKIDRRMDLDAAAQLIRAALQFYTSVVTTNYFQMLSIEMGKYLGGAQIISPSIQQSQLNQKDRSQTDEQLKQSKKSIINIDDPISRNFLYQDKMENMAIQIYADEPILYYQSKSSQLQYKMKRYQKQIQSISTSKISNEEAPKIKRKKKKLKLKNLSKKKIYEKKLEAKRDDDYSSKHELEELYNTIIALREKLEPFRHRFFLSDMKSMWFSIINDNQIKKKIFSFSQPQKNIKAIKKDILVWEKEIDELLFNNEATCNHHKGIVHYVCNNEYLPKLIYLCNQCILQIRNTHSHKNHQIVCKKHRQPIQWIIAANDNPDIEKDEKTVKYQDQQYVCTQCRIGNEKQQISLITKCHFCIIEEVCLQSKCIQEGQFIICNFCADKHQMHNKVKFSRHQMMEKFSLNRDVHLESYGYVFLDIKERLKLRPVVKMVGAMTDKMWQVVRLLESFNVEDENKLRMWVEQIVKEGKKEDMSVLWGVDKIKDLSQEERICFLEVFKDRLEQQQEKTFSKIWQLLQKMGSSVQTYLYINQQQIEKNLNNKYRRVHNDDKSQQIPMKLLDINPIHHHRIQELIINKDFEEVHMQELGRKEKEERKVVFKATNAIIKQITFENPKKQKQFQQFYRFIVVEQNKINDCILKKENLHNQKESLYPSIKPNRLIKFNEIVKSLLQQLKKIRQTFEAEREKCIPLEWIFTHSQNLTNLRIIRVSYSQDYISLSPYDERKCDYSVNAFVLFKAVYGLLHLVELEIIGVQVQHTHLFAKCMFRTAGAIEKTDIGLDKKESKFVGEKWDQLRKWLPKFHPNLISLSINSMFELQIDGEAFSEQLKVMKFLIRQFKSVSQIRVRVSKGKSSARNQITEVEEIRQCLSSLHNIRLQFQRIVSVSLLDLLFSLNSIRELEFRNTRFPVLEGEESKAISAILNKMFSRNAITTLTIFNCNNFPNLMQTQSLRHIKLLGTPNSNILPFLVNNNPSLITVAAFQNFVDQNNPLALQQLGDLEGLKIDSDYLGSPQSIQTLPGSFLKVLHIRNDYYSVNIDQSKLEDLFGRLDSITDLAIQWIGFRSQLLRRIPSPKLRRLSIVGNQNITNEDIQVVDCRWPCLTYLKISRCARVDGRIFGKCKFIGLTQLVFQGGWIQEADSCLEYLCRRGIKIKQW